jgi:5-(carboxyamino)imidazole ribonucleotide synthase
MSAQAAQQMGLKVVILDSDPNCPAGQITMLHILKDWNSEVGTAELANKASVLTLENEWASPANLLLAERLGATVIPSPATLDIIGDKLKQRSVLAVAGLRSPRFRSLNSWDDLTSALTEWDGRVVLKSRRGGYDGYGVTIVKAPVNMEQLPSSDAAEWYVEEYIPFERELAVMVSKNSSGQTSVYPIVESRQTKDGHRCDIIIAPAPDLTDQCAERVREIALTAVGAVGGIGLYGVELFQCGEDVIVNEVAPRPHNSGHYTMNGCRTSQFAQHIRSIKNWPPGPTDLLAPVVVMANLLAPKDGKIDLSRASANALRACQNAHIHWYGKNDMRPGRKMGHINVLGDTIEGTLSAATSARDAFWRGVL